MTDEIADSVGLKKAMGALVMEVTKDSPADKAGIKVGDIITKFNGKDVKEMHNLPRMVADAAIGKTAQAEIWRKGESKSITVTLGELKDQDDAQGAQGSEDED